MRKQNTLGGILLGFGALAMLAGCQLKERKLASDGFSIVGPDSVSRFSEATFTVNAPLKMRGYNWVVVNETDRSHEEEFYCKGIISSSLSCTFQSLGPRTITLTAIATDGKTLELKKAISIVQEDAAKTTQQPIIAAKLVKDSNNVLACYRDKDSVCVSYPRVYDGSLPLKSKTSYVLDLRDSLPGVSGDFLKLEYQIPAIGQQSYQPLPKGVIDLTALVLNYDKLIPGAVTIKLMATGVPSGTVAIKIISLQVSCENIDDYKIEFNDPASTRWVNEQSNNVVDAQPGLLIKTRPNDEVLAAIDINGDGVIDSQYLPVDQTQTFFVVYRGDRVPHVSFLMKSCNLVISEKFPTKFSSPSLPQYARDYTGVDFIKGKLTSNPNTHSQPDASFYELIGNVSPFYAEKHGSADYQKRMACAYNQIGDALEVMVTGNAVYPENDPNKESSSRMHSLSLKTKPISIPAFSYYLNQKNSPPDLDLDAGTLERVVYNTDLEKDYATEFNFEKTECPFNKMKLEFEIIQDPNTCKCAPSDTVNLKVWAKSNFECKTLRDNARDPSGTRFGVDVTEGLFSCESIRFNGKVKCEDVDECGCTGGCGFSKTGTDRFGKACPQGKTACDCMGGCQAQALFPGLKCPQVKDECDCLGACGIRSDGSKCSGWDTPCQCGGCPTPPGGGGDPLPPPPPPPPPPNPPRPH